MQSDNVDNGSKKNNLIVEDSEQKLNAVLEEAIPDPEKRSVILTQVMQIERHSGPLPSPNQMREYESINGALPIILKMAEKEQSFRHKISYLQLFYPYLGLCFGFLSFLTCIGGSYFLASIGSSRLAATLIGVTTGGVIALMVKERIFPSKKEKQENNNQKKNQKKNQRR